MAVRHFCTASVTPLSDPKCKGGDQSGLHLSPLEVTYSNTHNRAWKRWQVCTDDYHIARMKSLKKVITYAPEKKCLEHCVLYLVTRILYSPVWRSTWNVTSTTNTSSHTRAAESSVFKKACLFLRQHFVHLQKQPTTATYYHARNHYLREIYAKREKKPAATTYRSTSVQQMCTIMWLPLPRCIAPVTPMKTAYCLTSMPIKIGVPSQNWTFIFFLNENWTEIFPAILEVNWDQTKQNQH